MYPHSYEFVTAQRTFADSRCCVACARLDARPVATEPHAALSQTAEESQDHNGTKKPAESGLE